MARDKALAEENELATEESAVFEPKDSGELARFLEVNKEKYREIWIVITKKKGVHPQSVSFSEAINEAVKQGLIDSRTKSLSEQKYAIRFTKRKPKD